MAIAPSPQFPERQGPVYERKLSPAQTGLRGPLRFEEGIATEDRKSTRLNSSH